MSIYSSLIALGAAASVLCWCCACRRNYTAIFEYIQRTPALMQSQGVVLTLIGHGDLHIPDALHGKVVKRTSLDYKVRSSIKPGYGCKRS